jgi:N-acetylmuramoyl-L-alanine amidase-like protein
MARWPAAVYLGPPDANWGGSVQRPPSIFVEHIAEGSYQGTIGWQQNPVSDVSSHFVIGLGGFDTGEVAQMLDTDLAAWTQANGNPYCISAEFAGFSTGQYTPQQQEAASQLYAWLHITHGLPLQLSNSPSEPGWGWHGMGGAAWGNHPDCPGPANVALRGPMLARTLQIVNGSDGGPDMGVQMLVRFTDAPAEAGGPNQVWICDGMFRRKVAQDLAWGQSVTDGGIGNNGTHTAGMLGNLGNSGQVFAAGPGGWAGRDAWGVDIATLSGGGGGGGGATPAQVSAAVRAELDKTRLTA